MQLTSQATGALRFQRCQTIPHPQNQAFYGRGDVLQDISAAFEEQTSRPASVAIWGTGGIGKTHIALEFAHSLWASGKETILWIASETAAEVAKSFNDAAKRLELEGYSATNTPDQNRHLVLQWLQHTDTSWLLVFDNVESSEAAIHNWPTVGNAKILVTCRSFFGAEADTIAKAIEVPAFNVSESTEMIHKILRRSTRAIGHGDNLEQDATNRLASKLGGLPLAIDIVAKQIKLSHRFKTVAEYLPYYEENQESALKRPKRGAADPWYNRDLHNLWQPAFDNLSKDAAELMGILSFLSPEAIPTFLFQGKDWSALRPHWEFLEDEKRQVLDPPVEEATNVLLESALISFNDETGILSVHRLIQDSYFVQMTPTRRIESFHSALILRTHFPSQETSGARHFFTKWALCGRLHQHIVAFRERCQSPNNQAAFPTNDLTFIDLVRDDAWYMVETQQFLEAESSLLSILGDVDDGSLLAASIQRSLLGLYERTGRSIKACRAAELEFKILEHHGVSEGNNRANTNSNVGYTMVSARRGVEGLRYLNAAVSMAKSHPEPKRYKEYNIDRFLRNRGRCKMQMGQFDEALKDFDEAEYFQNKIHGPDSHYHGEYDETRALQDCRLARRSKLGRPAQPQIPDPTFMATLYRQGWIAMLQGDYDDALQLLEKALVVCQLNEPHRGNAGEAARVQWRMSQVYERKGMGEEAKRLRGTAEKVKHELLATGDYALVEDDEEAGWDALVGLLYR
ncbi:P-loop containing nucleoside triphosphate hydrolase protein [Podospora aff. communis PSN243]|uniref:P-loop containing nucleoside triphosphate hydrolase protein n=1 Tax=Podospora aff. communis PSN243 TaxID=3040156 RepID=A0AAV9GGC6_9PEZI|nr:P-loop containing nucleoside triphosphate hydrolase protein [Podospora aff. communis PSN243]